MTFTSIIDISDLKNHLEDQNWVIVDCRFDLSDPDACQSSYVEAHIPGAVYAHLDKDLCGEVIPGKTGRHPLPKIDDFKHTLENLGITSGTQVVAYDDKGGALAAARLWWMLRWVGIKSVSVLNGGWQIWVQQNLPTQNGWIKNEWKPFHPEVNNNMVVDSIEVAAMTNDPDSLVFDSRILERFRGEFEPIDPVAGHIPGARSAPHPNVLDKDGRFRPQDALLVYFQKLLGNVPSEKTAFYCGSGVTAVQNILAMYYAGLGEAKLYAGSWSEWIIDQEHPIETG